MNEETPTPEDKPTVEQVLQFIAERIDFTLRTALGADNQVAFVVVAQVGDENRTVTNLKPEGMVILLEDTLDHIKADVEAAKAKTR